MSKQSHYSIIQFVPNPIADERINIGVLAFDEKSVRVQFLQNWERVQNFGWPKKIDFLKDFVNRMEEMVKDGKFFKAEENRHERMTQIARGCINSVQFTEPRGSLMGVDKLLDDIASDFLIEP